MDRDPHVDHRAWKNPLLRIRDDSHISTVKSQKVRGEECVLIL